MTRRLIDMLAQRILTGDKRAAARLMTMVESGIAGFVMQRAVRGAMARHSVE